MGRTGEVTKQKITPQCWRYILCEQEWVEIWKSW